MQIVWSNQDLILMVSGFLTTSDLRHRHLDRDLWRLASWFLLGRRFIEIKPEKISPPTKTIVCKKKLPSAAIEKSLTLLKNKRGHDHCN